MQLGHFETERAIIAFLKKYFILDAMTGGLDLEASLHESKLYDAYCTSGDLRLFVRKQLESPELALTKCGLTPIVCTKLLRVLTTLDLRCGNGEGETSNNSQLEVIDTVSFLCW